MNKGSSKRATPRTVRFAEGDDLKGRPSERERTGREAEGKEEMQCTCARRGRTGEVGRKREREREERMAERRASDRDERRGLRKINTRYVSEGVYTRPRAQGNSYMPVVFNLCLFYRPGLKRKRKKTLATSKRSACCASSLESIYSAKSVKMLLLIHTK